MSGEHLMKAVRVNNPASFTPSLRPLRGLRFFVHGAGLFPRFFYALFCKAPPAALLAQRFPVSLSKEKKITCLSPSLGTLFLFPGIYRHRRHYSNQGSIPAYRCLLAFTSSAARPCAASPSFGPFARRPSWPWALGSSLRVHSRSVQIAPQARFHGTAFRKHNLARSSSHFRQTESAQPFPAVSRPAFSRHAIIGTPWPQTSPGSLRPCRPPSPQTPHLPHTPQ